MMNCNCGISTVFCHSTADLSLHNHMAVMNCNLTPPLSCTSTLELGNA